MITTGCNLFQSMITLVFYYQFLSSLLFFKGEIAAFGFAGIYVMYTYNLKTVRTKGCRIISIELNDVTHPFNKHLCI